MTELKIKQADINNNGNQSLMGDYWGRGETPNMYHIWMWVCTRVGEWLGQLNFVFCCSMKKKKNTMANWKNITFLALFLFLILMFLSSEDNVFSINRNVFFPL